MFPKSSLAASLETMAVVELLANVRSGRARCCGEWRQRQANVSPGPSVCGSPREARLGEGTSACLEHCLHFSEVGSLRLVQLAEILAHGGEVEPGFPRGRARPGRLRAPLRVRREGWLYRRPEGLDKVVQVCQSLGSGVSTRLNGAQVRGCASASPRLRGSQTSVWLTAFVAT